MAWRCEDADVIDAKNMLCVIRPPFASTEGPLPAMRASPNVELTPPPSLPPPSPPSGIWACLNVAFLVAFVLVAFVLLYIYYLQVGRGLV